TVTYKGKGSSALFANKVLQARGLTKKNEGLLYEELEKRAHILTEMANRKIYNYYEVFEHIAKANEIGIDSYIQEVLV
nr:flagellar protein FlaI [Candidatus Korarchaeota archaeon]